MFEVRLTPQAERAYLRLEEKTRQRIDGVFERLEHGGFPTSEYPRITWALCGGLTLSARPLADRVPRG